MRCSSPPLTPTDGHSNTYWLIRGYAALRINCNKGSAQYINSSVDHLLSSLRVFAHNSNMNYHQLTKALLVLSCLASDALAGLLPGGNAGGTGYQYNRPGGGGGFGGPGGFSGNLGGGRGGDFGGSFSGRPSTSYGPPGGGGSGGGDTGAFSGGRPSNTYGPPGGGQFGGGYQDGGFQGGYGGRPQPYSFQYEVYDPPSGNDYSQRESSDGNVVQGEYRVLLPDSRTQIVKYMADDANGYTADVQYEGQAQYSRGGAGAYGGGAGGSGGYQGGAGGYQQGGYQGGYSGGAASNQYLPPRSNYRK
ncbi:PREDICTED: pro-resilin-like [Habropoda laboriosa]|uniref:pro-resilin-like n=1 Tax=Habropoda laboriosa TaxID=597456 RepID=UPI00083D266C|nr:PREDICTED: pro-resilin-like [Habropoda laboriosa]